MRTSLRIVSAAAIALLLVACGGDDDDDTTDATEIELEEVDEEDASSDDESSDDESSDDEEATGELHACELVTPDEVEAVLAASESEGQETSGDYTVTFGESNTDDGYSGCQVTWETVDQVSGTPQARGDFQIELMLAERLSFTREEFDEKPIDGVDGADEAFLISETPYAVVGDLAVGILNLQRGEEAGIELLKAVVANL